MRLSRSLRPLRLLRQLRSLRLQRFYGLKNYYWGQKSPPGSWIQLYFDALKYFDLVDSWNISHWNLPTFLLEAVEASRCHFFENWSMKLKCPILPKLLATKVQENYQSFYPSEPFTLDHIIMRHPVIQDETLQCHIYLESEHFLNNINN